MSIILLMLSIVGLALLVAGFMVQARNRSPYSGTPMDQATKERQNVGVRLGAVGSLCILFGQLVRFWR